MITAENQLSRGKAVPIANLEKLLPVTRASASRGRTVPIADLAKLLGASFGPALRLMFDRSTVRQTPRLLQEGIDPVVHLLLQANNTAIINRWNNRGTKVVFLSSFPRSGNTWMRFMLADVLLQMQGIETTTELPVHPDNLIAMYGTDSIVRRLTRCPPWAFEPPLAFVKSHFLFRRLDQIFSDSASASPNWRVVYVYRRPEDALVSLFHFGFLDTYLRNRASQGIDAFCRTVVSDWVENISSYLRAADNGFPMFFVSYEQMLEKPAMVLADLFQWLGVKHESHMVPRAVSNMQFAKLQAREKQAEKTRHPDDENTLFFRRGGPGSGRAELQESTLREIHERTAPLLNQANHHQVNQSSVPHPPAAEVPNPSGASVPMNNGEATESTTSLRLQGK